ncbi:MAG: hypothetical protein ABEJ81_00130 [Haloferacaceae archaeon]
MPDIEITEDQRDRLHAVQEALAADVVGKYGHVRASDAVEYLLDRYEADGDEPDAGAGSIDAPTGNEGAPETVDADGTDGTGDDDGTDGTGDDATDDTGGDDGSADGRTGDGATDATGSDDTGGDDGSTDEGAGPAAVAGGDAAELDAMMNLLADHDDRWRESDAADARYEVDLPDGTTEHARTKDDVRGLLFRHYR